MFKFVVKLSELLFSISTFFEVLIKFASLEEIEIMVFLLLQLCRNFDSITGTSIALLHSIYGIFISI